MSMNYAGSIILTILQSFNTSRSVKKIGKSVDTARAFELSETEQINVSEQIEEMFV